MKSDRLHDSDSLIGDNSGGEELNPTNLEKMNTLDPDKQTFMIKSLETNKVSFEDSVTHRLNPDGPDYIEDCTNDAATLDKQSEHIKNVHEEHSLKKNQCENPKEMLGKLSFKVPLDKLYRLVASCNYNVQNRFCPVLVEIKDKVALLANNEKPYLLQVWNLQGECVFERALEKPVANWNINIFHDIFFFQECSTSSDIWLVKLKDKKAPFVYRLRLPPGVIDPSVRVNSHFDAKLGTYIIPQEVVPPDSDGDNDDGFDALQFFHGIGQEIVSNVDNWINDFDLMKSRGDLRKNSMRVAPDINQKPGKSVSEILTGEIIERAPDKMMQIDSGFLILAWRNDLVVIGIKALGILDADEDGKNFKHIDLTNDQLQFIKLRNKYKIITLQDIGCESKDTQICLVLEEIRTRLIRYLKLDYNDDGSESERQLTLSQLGIMVTRTKLSPSPLLKYRSISRVDRNTGSGYQIGIVIRENGRWEVYSDFMLVYDWHDRYYQCVDIETDFNRFYLKFVINSRDVNETTKFDELKFEIRRVGHAWRNQINFDTSKKKSDINDWNIILHKRVASYFKIYSAITNCQMFMLVSHRNMISVYKMTVTENEWITQALEGGSVRDIFVKKRPQDQVEEQIRISHPELGAGLTYQQIKAYQTAFDRYQIVVLKGINEVSYHNLTASGQLRKDLQMDQNVADQINHRIMGFKNDVFDKFGIFILTDERDIKTIEPEYLTQEGSRIYTFPYAPQNVSRTTLRSIRRGKVYDLLSSDDTDALTPGSNFRTVKVNKKAFEFKKKEFGDNLIDQEDEVASYYTKDYIYAIVVTSGVKSKSCIFPLAYKRDNDDSRHMKDFYCIKNPKNIRTIELKDSEDTEIDPPLHSFYVYDEELGEENVDSYFQISQHKLTIYDPDLKPESSFDHLGIRSCLDVQQSYLYTMSDPIDSSFTKHTYDEDGSSQKFDVGHEASSGLYVYDTKKLLEGWIEKYRLAKAIGGVCNHLEKSLFYDRLSFVQDYNNLVFVPIPHLNLLNMVGMGGKSEYLVWRQKNGFFTALDKQGELLTWSLVSGKLLYAESQNGSGSKKALQGYEVYRADNEDITYLRDFQCYDDYTVQLLYIPTAIHDCDHKILKEAMATQFKFKQKNVAKKNKIHDVASLDPEIMSSTPQINIEVNDNLADLQEYHFKVLKLRVHEDTKSGSEVSLLFQFAFPRLIAQDGDQDDGNYDWNIYKNPHQRLFLSQDTTLLMEVINNFLGTVYYRINVDKKGNEILGTVGAEPMGQAVRWRVLYRIRQFPTELSKLTSVPFLFSPNFKYYLDYHYREQEFIIRKTKGQTLYMNIPKDFLTTSWNVYEGWQAIKLIYSRFQWVSEKVLRFVNESNLDCLLEICTTDPKDKDAEKRYLKLLSAAKVDNLYENLNQIDSNHLLLDRVQLQDCDTLPRIIRMNQNYKTQVVHSTTLGLSKFKEKTGKSFNLLNLINTVDYTQSWDDKRAKFDVELAYTILDWQIAEQIMTKTNFDIEDVEEEERTQLCFNIWPRGWGLLHMLSAQGVDKEKQSGSHNGDFIKAWKNVQGMFDICQNAPDLDLMKTDVESSQMGLRQAEEVKESRATRSLEIPILPNIFGYTCLDYCLPGEVPSHHVDYEIFKEDPDQLEFIRDSENIALGGRIFQNITDYGLMHSSPFINSALLDAITLGADFANRYLEASLKQVDHFFKQKMQYAIKEDSLRKCSAFEYGAVQASVWESEDNIKKNVFETKGTVQPMNLRFLDIQYLFKNTPIGRDFIHALQRCENMDFFENSAVQIIIDNQWKYWKTKSFYFFGIPLATHLILFLYWSNIILSNKKLSPEVFDSQNQIAIYLMCIISFYLLLMEIPLIVKIGPKKWVQSVHSLVNVANNVLILFNCINPDVLSERFWGIQTYAALLIWWRFVLYLRTFEKFSWMVRLVQQSLDEIKFFILIFFCIVLSFADAILSIQHILEIQDPENFPTIGKEEQMSMTLWQRYAHPYFNAIRMSYLTSIGEFDEVYWSYPDGWWIVFFLSTLINVIILLNSLIAITGTSYETIQESTVARGYKEKVHQIQWLQDNIGFIFKQEAINSERLFVCHKMDSENTAHENESSTQKQINKLAKDVEDMRSDLNRQLENLDKICTQISQTMHSDPSKKQGKKVGFFSGAQQKRDIKETDKLAANKPRMQGDIGL